LVEKVKSYGGLTVCYYISGIAQISAIVYSLLLRAAPPPLLKYINSEGNKYMNEQMSK